ncbi:hypothetical protein KUCAC02_029369, partial [Chaenocephalus aceratus]
QERVSAEGGSVYNTHTLHPVCQPQHKRFGNRADGALWRRSLHLTPIRLEK